MFLQKTFTVNVLLLLSLFVFSCSKETSNPIQSPTPTPIPPPPAVLPPVGNTSISVPLAGNAFITSFPSGATELIDSNGLTSWNNPSTICSGYFRVEKAGEINLALRLKVADGTSQLKVAVNGVFFNLTVTNHLYENISVGKVNITAPGYVKVDLQGVTKTKATFAEVSNYIITIPLSNSLKFANDSLNFYWSRRGPSVNLSYDISSAIIPEWFYNELTVPVGQDKIGSYFMSNGFGEGYFGMQVNSETRRIILFSVWDPAIGQGTTQAIRSGPNVTIQRFGGEGTGGQSLLAFDWKAGVSYKFLTQGKPDGQGNTLYSSWFYAPETAKWQFLATWKRPNTSKYLTGLYSFLENFSDKNGWMERTGNYNNQWVRSSSGAWTELISAKFDGDATAINQQRLDFAGGVDKNGGFYLRNGGFFNEYVNLKQNFTRTATGIQPTVNLSTLP